MCVCVCVCVSLIAAASLLLLTHPLLLLPHSVILPPPLSLSLSLSLSSLSRPSTCRALAVNQPAALCHLPLTFCRTPLIGWERSVAEKITDRRTCESAHACVCVCVCVSSILRGSWLEWQVVVFLSLRRSERRFFYFPSTHDSF